MGMEFSSPDLPAPGNLPGIRYPIIGYRKREASLPDWLTADGFESGRVIRYPGFGRYEYKSMDIFSLMLFIESISSVRQSGLLLQEKPVFGCFGERLAREMI